MLKTLILIAAIAALVFWWRRRSRPALPPVEKTYVCPACDENDCICQKDPDKETRNQP